VEPVSLITRTDVLDGFAIVSVVGDVDLASAAHLGEALGAALQQSSHLIVDVADMTFIDSSGLSALVQAHRRATDEGGTVTLRHPSTTLKRLLTLTRLETVLLVDDGEPATPTTNGEA
jgi:anti-sigma B factor antagonist